MGPHLAQCGLDLHAKCHLDPSSRLATIDMGRKLGAPPFWGGEAGSPSNTMSLGPRPTLVPSGILIHPAIWPQQVWGKNWWRGLCPFGGREAGSPSNTMWPGPRPTCVPSFILIHPTIWSQYTNVTDRQDRTGQGRQRSNSIGQTVFGRTFVKRFALCSHYEYH